MSNAPPPIPGQPGPRPNPFGTPPIPQQQPVPPPAGGFVQPKAGMTADPSTLAASGLLAAVIFALAGGFFGFLGGPSGIAFRQRLLLLTNTVDVGDVALLGIAVALMLLTPDPPGGISRPLLLRVTAALAAVISLYGVIRALVIISEGGAELVLRFGGFVATLGVSIAAATIAFYAAKESFLKGRGQI